MTDPRLVTFQQDAGINANTGQSGLKMSLLLGLGAFNAFQAGDVLNDFSYAIRPYEVVPGSTSPKRELVPPMSPTSASSVMAFPPPLQLPRKPDFGKLYPPGKPV